MVLETYCQVGKSAISDAKYDVALRWLRRALESSDALSQGSPKSDMALKDQRLLILHAIGERPSDRDPLWAVERLTDGFSSSRYS